MRRKKNENQRDPFAHWQRISSRARCGVLLTGILAPVALLLWGCSSGSGQNTQTPPPQSYSISGTISPAAGGGGATVTLSGAASSGTTADSSGNYTFTGLANGTYAVTPSHTGYTFSPTSEKAMVNGANVTGLNFTATVQRAHSVALAWNKSASTVSGYNVYRSTVSGTGYTKLNSSLVSGLAYTDWSVQNGTTYYYVTRAVDASGIESDNSNQASASIP
jgi:ABC-type oligopeptide transport system substrate-binding subunit